MAQSKITIIGLENFLQPDHSLFENLVLPEGIDKDTLVSSILLRCSEFEVMYPDPDFLSMAITLWGKKNYWTFNKWAELINKQYDPLYNKDYYEEIQDTHQGAASTSGSTSQSDDYTRTDNLQSSSNITDTHSEKAYNDSSFVQTTQDESHGTGSNTGTQRNAGTTSGTFGDTKNDSYVDGHTYHGYGNIGITSAQELFQKEAEVARFNLYNQISDLFCQEFCIMVY